MSDDERPIIIKRIKKIEAGAHGGAWKVAYADFVTAMMAFFLLMWLINMTSPEQKRGIADYFAPASVSKTTSGSGGVLAGQSFADAGARAEGSAAVSAQVEQPRPKSSEDSEGSGSGSEKEASTTRKMTNEEIITLAKSKQESRMFDRAEQSIRQALKDMPELTELSKHIIVDQTPEGLRIQIVDQEGRPMFPPGDTAPYERTKKLLRSVSKIITELPNRITVSGHTDSAPFFRADGYSNWDLSADRANAARKIMQQAGIDTDRIYFVAGKAGSEPLFPDDPFASSNRRISVILLREAPVLPPGHTP